MPLLSFQDVDYSVGGPLLLERANWSLEPGERISVIGRNGAGKSTLLKLIAGELQPDDGQIVRQSGLNVGRLPQEVPADLCGPVVDIVTSGCGEMGRLLAEYEHLSTHGAEHASRLQLLHDLIDTGQGWNLQTRVHSVLQRFELDGEAEFAALSGGLKRRVLLARAVLNSPDILLLDEPTNHLDIPAIEWLQDYLVEFPGAVIFVTHDRALLRAVATRIIEIDRGRLTSWPGDYDNYLRRRAEREHAEALADQHFDRKLAEEEVWIRQGIKARRTRNEGRVRALKKMRDQRAQRREVEGRASMQLTEAAQSGRRVILAEQLGYGWNAQTLIQPFDLTLMRGDRLGIVGRNGSGKTTLVRLLLGELQPTEGTVALGTGLEIAYFDQHRSTLREDWTALDNVAEGREYIELDGKRKHVLGYLQDFLFSPERARAPITRLSGGERNRLLLAKLFAKPSNLLVMDEPTNDLDAETLELLEEQLAEYRGTVIMVSHDRAFLDEVVTSLLVIDDQGRVTEWVGGYQDWQRQRPAETAPSKPSAEPKPAAGAGSESKTERRAAKLSYKDQRELDALPARIETLEVEMQSLQSRMSSPDFYRQAADQIVAEQAKATQLQLELDAAYARWEALEAQQNG
ncbi:ATP-binding cassette domain-containing protein [Pseudomarimonas arenosa]|uniref:ATP-binding protein Uup n=1 Tax=Pseudomarimonas arenosa TaxID=2774145 RepID=A0AAW3ZT53_9GAMM|nr:ATP-binding cassette domain-containing protein [Pseudomarimonas arenosa]MBD8528237.1 ATP-binding cassette domain-containing protein [Pseudomarimonas arenosa]